MSFRDVSEGLKKLAKGNSKTDDKPFDHAESYRIRAKMLGVLICDARLAQNRSIEDCANFLGIDPSTYEAFELGDECPSLPELELLAFYLGVPISHFWSQKTLEADQKSIQSQQQYQLLRQRMIGALLSQARQEANLSLEELAAQSYLEPDLLEQYEQGELPIPMHHLTVLSNEVRQNMTYFLELSGMIGKILQQHEEWQKFAAMDPETRSFVSNPVNIGFIEIALMFSHMPTDRLRKIAEGLLEITM